MTASEVLHKIDLFLGKLFWNLTHELPVALGLKEYNRVKGELTVIKNQGRPDEEVLAYKKYNLLTDAGRDKAHAQIYTNTSAGARGAGFIAVTTDATAPADSDTTLTSEITTGGLARADASTKTHTAGTNSSTKEFYILSLCSTCGVNSMQFHGGIQQS